MRTGVSLVQNRPWPEMVAHARWLEDLGFETLWLPDHMAHSYNPAMPWADAWVTLGALAGATSRIRLGTMVTCMTFRNPVVLAREVLTVDQISGGRVDVGVGAAGAELDHRMAGIPLWTLGERVERFAEFVELLGRLLQNDCRDYDGRFYRCQDASLAPGPAQNPRPPLVVSAQGPRSIRTAAAFGDRWVSFASYPTPSRKDPSRNTPDFAVGEAKLRLEQFHAACADLGRNPSGIRKTMALVGAAVKDSMRSAGALVDLAGRMADAGYDDIILWPHDATGACLFDGDGRAEFERVVHEAAPFL